MTLDSGAVTWRLVDQVEPLKVASGEWTARHASTHEYPVDRASALLVIRAAASPQTRFVAAAEPSPISL